MVLVTAEEMRRLDRTTIDVIGIPGAVLMENAGQGVVRAIVARRGVAGQALILCGRGNNGGDGYVVARGLAEAGWRARVVLCARRDQVTGDARLYLDVLDRLGMDVVEAPDEARLREALAGAGTFDVVVDALLGTGAQGEVRGLYRTAIEWANAALGYKVAVDIPSGVDSDTGALLGVAFRADLTVTFGYPKHGLVHYPGAGCAGERIVAPIGVPPEVVAQHEPRDRLIEPRDAAALVTEREPDAHKGSFGHVLVIAGSRGKAGAALLTARGALLAGAGLVTVATDRECQPSLEGRIPELMVEAWRQDPQDAQAASSLAGLMAGKDVVVAGPGLGPTAATRALVEALLGTDGPALVLDADALNVLAGEPELLRHAKAPVVITPHPGETGRLLGLPTAGVQADRPGAARALAARAGAHIVLKGARTVLADPAGRLRVVLAGNPGMATAGSGDALAGILGALLARTGRVDDALDLGVCLHGLAGDLAAAAGSPEGVTAASILDFVPAAWRRLRELRGRS